jgi:hypothetical protein
MSNFIDVVTDVGEVVIDQGIEEGILKDLPVLGTIVGVYKTAKSIKDKLFFAEAH